MRLSFLALIAVSLAFAQSQPAKTAQAYTPPRTADGQPDIEGTWQPQSGGAIYSVLPHSGGFFLGNESKTGIVDGAVLPYQPWAQEEVNHLTDHMELDPTGHCHYEGIPHANMFAFRVYQTPEYIAILHENMHARRLIYLNGKPHPQGYKAWMGDSRGHWEGNVLVVDVADNNDKAVFDMAGHFHSDALHVVERFTIVDKNRIDYEATFDDPKVFTRPFKMGFPMRRAANPQEPFESDCFGGERDQEHIVNGLATLKEHYYSK
ncbi:MAG TPA: hypothetical protein VHY84_25865 [Bryobacteraceae bacterium]|jgi:hypothetical protein|nr:hypothetical protein [Bryobacteraceae bacterium]